MQKILLMVALSLSAATLPVIVDAHGCIKDAAVGAVAGHLAGHHGVAGAAIGCAVGHHRAKMNEKQAAQAQAGTPVQPAPPTPPGRLHGTTST